MNEEEVAPKYRVGNMRLEELPSEDLANRIRMAVNSLEDLAYFDGAHHKQYAIDQAVQILLGRDNYALWKQGRLDWDNGMRP